MWVRFHDPWQTLLPVQGWGWFPSLIRGLMSGGEDALSQLWDPLPP